MQRSNHTRRTFLKRTGVATGLAVGLAGCTGGDGGDGGETPAPATTARTASRGNETLRSQYELPEFDYELEDTINVFQWADYWPKGTIAKFEDAYDVTANVSNYASNEEMFNKLKAGGTGQFDVIFPSDYMVNILVEQSMIRPLDLGMVPHWENLESKWVDEAPYDPGDERYSAPYFWGTSGIGWNANMLPEGNLPITSWDAMWNEEYAGQMTMLNDVRETLGASLKRLGYSLNSTNEDEIDEAKEELIKQKDLLLTYDSINMAENLINENASPIHSWSGSPFSAYWELWEEGEGSPIGYRVPEEGSVVWVDTACVTKEAKHPNAAHAFVNFVLNAKMNGEIANYVYYPTPNAAAKEYVYDSMLENERIYPPDSIMQKLEFIKNLGQATTLWDEAWTEIQNA